MVHGNGKTSRMKDIAGENDRCGGHFNEIIRKTWYEQHDSPPPSSRRQRQVALAPIHPRPQPILHRFRHLRPLQLFPLRLTILPPRQHPQQRQPSERRMVDVSSSEDLPPSPRLSFSVPRASLFAASYPRRGSAMRPLFAEPRSLSGLQSTSATISKTLLSRTCVATSELWHRSINPP